MPDEQPPQQVPRATGTAPASTSTSRDRGGVASSGSADGPQHPAWAFWRAGWFVQLVPSLLVFVAFGVVLAVTPDLRERVFGTDRAGQHAQAARQVEVLLDSYFYRGDVDVERLFQEGLRGMVASLGDRYTTYLDPVDQEDTRRLSTGRFAGIGIQLIQGDDGYPVVFTPFPDTPAWEAGIRPGDRFLEIDGHDPLEGDGSLRARFQRAVDDRLRGEAGSTVTLRIAPREGDAGAERTVTVTRGPVHVPSVVDIRLLDLDAERPRGGAPRDRVGYFSVTGFQTGTATEAVEAIEQLRIRAAVHNAALGTLILDLRGNRGGTLYDANELAGLFLEPDALIAFTKGGGTAAQQAGSEAETVFVADESTAGRFRDIGLIVLVDGGSASASELVAGALKDHQRAVLIGTRTFGKGLVQRVIALGSEGEDLGAVKITTARYFTPSGRVIQRADAYRISPATGRRFPATDAFRFCPETGVPLENAPQIDAGGYRGGIEPDIPIELTEAELIDLRTWQRQQMVHGGPPITEGIYADFDRAAWTDPQLTAALALLAGRLVPHRYVSFDPPDPAASTDPDPASPSETGPDTDTDAAPAPDAPTPPDDDDRDRDLDAGKPAED